MIRFMIAFVLFAATLVNAHEVDKSNMKGLEERLDKVERQQSNLKNETASDKKNLERRVDEIESGTAAGFGLFVSGILCALWAQFTRRSAWLWFFFGLFLVNEWSSA